MRRRAAGLLVLAVAFAAAGGAGLAQEATPLARCNAGPATPVPGSRTINEEIAVELDRLFDCLSVRDWAAVANFVDIPDGQADPFHALTELDRTGLFTISTGVVSQAMRSTALSGTTVDLAWRVGSQLRYDRWTFQRANGRWRIVAVEPGVPLYDGVIVGITGRIELTGVVLPRSELINPGGVELALEVGPDVPAGTLLLVFPDDACARAQPSPMTAVVEVGGETVTVALDAPDDGAYALALVSTNAPLSRASICAAPAAVLKMTS